MHVTQFIKLFFILGLHNNLVLVFVWFFQFGPTFYFVFNLVLTFVNFIQFDHFH